MGERSYKRRLGLNGDAAPQKNEYISGYKPISTANPIRFVSAIPQFARGTWISRGSMSISCAFGLVWLLDHHR